MTATAAWVMAFSDGGLAAVGELELVHVLPESPDCFELPGRPDYCNRVFIWEDQVVPLFDPGAYSESGSAVTSKTAFIGIVRYRAGQGERPSFGALSMRQIPRRVDVADELACALPDALKAWWPFVVSCFMHENQPVPVLDVARLFGAPLSAAA